MNSGIYTAYSGLKAQADALEILSNNLANLNTTAFKEEKAFTTYLDQGTAAMQKDEGLGGTINRSVRVAAAVNPETGSLEATGRDLDIAIEGAGFLSVLTSRGVRYTRNGSLNLNAQSVLVASDGSPVMGETGKPVRLEAGTVRIGEGGEVFLDNRQVGRLKIVAFDDLSKLQKEGNSLFAPRSAGLTERKSDARIKSGYLEQSNVNPVSSVVRMVEILRHFEAIQKTVNLVMNEMNPKAIEKLGR